VKHLNTSIHVDVTDVGLHTAVSPCTCPTVTRQAQASTQSKQLYACSPTASCTAINDCPFTSGVWPMPRGKSSHQRLLPAGEVHLSRATSGAVCHRRRLACSRSLSGATGARPPPQPEPVPAHQHLPLALICQLRPYHRSRPARTPNPRITHSARTSYLLSPHHLPTQPAPITQSAPTAPTATNCMRWWVVYLTPKIERVISLLSASPVGEARCRCRKVLLTRIDYYYQIA
jgi:hypothetical protein